MANPKKIIQNDYISTSNRYDAYFIFTLTSIN